MFSPEVLDHFQSPRNAGRLPDATAVVELSNPVCGDVLRLAARVAGGRIEAAQFLCQGCTTAIACGSFLTAELTGKSLLDARAITAETISDGLGGLPSATRHAAQLAAETLAALLAKLPAR